MKATRARQEQDALLFRQGYYLAVANLMRMHDQPTIAADLLRNFGKLDLSGIDQHDADVLKQFVNEPT